MFDMLRELRISARSSGESWERRTKACITDRKLPVCRKRLRCCVGASTRTSCTCTRCSTWSRSCGWSGTAWTKAPARCYFSSQPASTNSPPHMPSFCSHRTSSAASTPLASLRILSPTSSQAPFKASVRSHVPPP
eukprot:1860192-Rhodomonas_salina.1